VSPSEAPVPKASGPSADPAGTAPGGGAKGTAAKGNTAQGSAAKAKPTESQPPSAGQTQPMKAPARPGSNARTAAAAPRRGRTGGPGQPPVNPNDETRPHAVVRDPERVPLGKPDGPAPNAGSPWSREGSREPAVARTATMDPVPGVAPGYTPAGAVPAPGYAAAPVATATPVQSGRQMARRARLKVSHLGPWSVFKVALTFSLCMFIVLLVAVAALWAVLDSAGVFKSIINAANTLTNDNKQTSIAEWLTFGRVMIIAVVLGAANVIAFTLLSTIGSLLYNLCSDFVGGIEVTLVER
jgi:hypothetical protein